MGALVAVKVSELLDVVWVSLLAGVTVTTCSRSSCCGRAKSTEARRARPLAGRGAELRRAGRARVRRLRRTRRSFGVQIMLSKD